MGDPAMLLRRSGGGFSGMGITESVIDGGMMVLQQPRRWTWAPSCACRQYSIYIRIQLCGTLLGVQMRRRTCRNPHAVKGLWRMWLPRPQAHRSVFDASADTTPKTVRSKPLRGQPPPGAKQEVGTRAGPLRGRVHG